MGANGSDEGDVDNRAIKVTEALMAAITGGTNDMSNGNNRNDRSDGSDRSSEDSQEQPTGITRAAERNQSSQ